METYYLNLKIIPNTKGFKKFLEGKNKEDYEGVFYNFIRFNGENPETIEILKNFLTVLIMKQYNPNDPFFGFSGFGILYYLCLYGYDNLLNFFLDFEYPKKMNYPFSSEYLEALNSQEPEECSEGVRRCFELIRNKLGWGCIYLK
jgi:hypothetical protein